MKIIDTQAFGEAQTLARAALANTNIKTAGPFWRAAMLALAAAYGEEWK